MSDETTYEKIKKRTKQLEKKDTAYKKCEQELIEFRQIFSMSIDMICIADINTSMFLRVNPAFTQILGWSEEELLQKSFLEFIHPDDIESTQSVVEKKLRLGAKAINFENRYRCKNSSYRWLNWVSRPDPDKGKTYAIARDITDQRQMVNKLDENEKKYRSLFYQAQVAIFRTNIDGKLIEINQRYAEIAGYDNVDDCIAEYSQKKAWSDPEARNEFLKRIQKTGSVSDYEAKVIRKDGTAIWILISATIFPDRGYVEGSIVNITDRKQAEETIRQSEALKRKMFANIGDVIVIIDKDGINRYKSPNIEKLFGWKPEEVVGKNTWEKLHPDDIASHQDFFKALMSEANTVKLTECRYKCKDGSYKWIEFIGTNLLHDPDICGILGNYHDITNRKTVENSLRESEARFKALHNASFGGIGIHDKGIILECNQGLSDMTGYSFDELIGMNGLLFIAEQSRPMVMDKILSGYEKPYEAIGLRKNGEEYPLRLEARNVPYKGKSVRTTEFRDITEQKKVEQDRKKLQDQLNQAQKMESVGNLAVGMAHEINNPLAGVIQNANLLSYRLTDKNNPANIKAAQLAGITMGSINTYIDSRSIPRMIKAITDSGARMASIVGNMLSFARKTDSSFSSHNPSELMDKVLELVSTDYNLKKQYDFKSISIQKKYENHLPMITCEGSKIQQVLLNLLNNGSHAMFAKGKDEDAPDPKFILRLSHKSDSDVLQIEIEDNGIGMDDITRKKIFEPFFTTKPVGEGTGLGLSVSYFIITKNHGGTMEVVSEQGKGANFIIRLPLKP